MNYLLYKFTKRQLLINILIGLIGIMVISKLFYGTFAAMIFLVPFIILFIKIRKKQLQDVRNKELKRQFKDAILSISDLMSVGYSIENSIRECYREMISIYGKDSHICRELKNMIKKVELNTPIEKVFEDFENRTDINEIRLFSQVFSIAKRTGGDMVFLIHMVSENISQSLHVEEEINVVISEKKLEQRIMTLVPIGIIVYVRVTSPGFLQVMYETIAGRIIMTICLAAYAAAFCIAEKIMNIEM